MFDVELSKLVDNVSEELRSLGIILKYQKDYKVLITHSTSGTELIAEPGKEMLSVNGIIRRLIQKGYQDGKDSVHNELHDLMSKDHDDGKI